MATNKKPVAVRLAPDVKAKAMVRASEENRSFASYLEWLVLQDVKRNESARRAA